MSFDDAVKDKVRTISSALAINTKAMASFIKERFKI